MRQHLPAATGSARPVTAHARELHVGSIEKRRKLATFLSSLMPQKLIFVPGTTSPGELMNVVKLCSDQTMPNFFIAAK
jgi:hypothetical protein